MGYSGCKNVNSSYPAAVLLAALLRRTLVPGNNDQHNVLVWVKAELNLRIWLILLQRIRRKSITFILCADQRKMKTDKYTPEYSK